MICIKKLNPLHYDDQRIPSCVNVGENWFQKLISLINPFNETKRLQNVCMISIVSMSSSFCKVCHYLFKTKIYVRELYMLWWVFKKTFDISVHFSAPKLMLICRILPCNSLHQPFCMSQSLFITLWPSSYLYRLFSLSNHFGDP